MQVATQLWPQKLALICASAGEQGGAVRTPDVWKVGLNPAPGTADSRRTPGTHEVDLLKTPVFPGYLVYIQGT